jgi:hypothetical protein
VAKAERFVQLKVTLNDIRPPIWRRLVLPSATTLEDLHFIIMAAMGWQGGHLHAFHAAERKYSDPSEVDGAADESRMTISGLVRLGVSRFRYTYDFGDDWEHAILIEKKQPPATSPNVAICVAGSRNCPPEDCGGAPGYEELLAALATPDTPESKEWIEAVGKGFDPEEFSVEKTNARMARRLGSG